MLAVTQMNGEHITPRIRAQEARSRVTYDLLEEVRLQLRKAGWGQVWGGDRKLRAEGDTGRDGHALGPRCGGFCQTHRIIHVT